jgi:hypothetical protein
MKKLIIIILSILTAHNIKAGGDCAWATTGKILTGAAAGVVITEALKPQPQVVYVQSTPQYVVVPQQTTATISPTTVQPQVQVVETMVPQPQIVYIQQPILPPQRICVPAIYISGPYYGSPHYFPIHCYGGYGYRGGHYGGHYGHGYHR